jgi:putative PEP-CTERM system integral membrane protein
LKQQDSIRAGLLNAYLAPLRYISAVGEVRHVSDMYKWSLNLSQEQALRVEQVYEAVARPVLYEPVNSRYDAARDQNTRPMENRALVEEPAEAARLYQTFFDRKIVNGERATIVRAVRSTWSAGEAQAAWQAVDDRAIRLTRQEITVVERGDWAEVELYEVYQNQTTQRQEVVYYFSLPESAVITGVWLGNTPDRTTRYAYQVAPRGAAQAVYQNEFRRNMDPALVEQIGPRQYRLRVFPVEPQSWQQDGTSNRSVIVNGPPLYMWLTWRVMAQAYAWPLPRLAEKRNVYWDAATTRLVNGAPMSATALGTPLTGVLGTTASDGCRPRARRNAHESGFASRGLAERRDRADPSRVGEQSAQAGWGCATGGRARPLAQHGRACSGCKRASGNCPRRRTLPP